MRSCAALVLSYSVFVLVLFSLNLFMLFVMTMRTILPHSLLVLNPFFA